MKYTPLFLILLSITALPCFGQGLSLRFLDAENGEALEGVMVVDQKSGARFFPSDAEGRLDIPVTSGSFRAELGGYLMLRFDVEEGDSILELRMQPLSMDLEGISVRAFASQRPIFEQAGGIHYLDTRAIRRFQEQSLVPALNTLPGIRMEERSPASYRMSIRGSSIRSPFGVRNVKVYWQGIPLTEPGGSTPLNLLETNNVGQIEVIKGPAGSLYGAGTGGALLFTNDKDGLSGLRAEAGTTLGSFGWIKNTVSVQQGGSKAFWNVQLTRQKGDGYRDHSAFERKTVQIDGRVKTTENGDLYLFTLLSDLQYQIPGGLNATQFAEDPQMARPGSATQASGIDQQYALSGLRYEWRPQEEWTLSAAAYLNASWFENPFILDFKRDQQGGLGMRALASWRPKEQWKIDLGTEWQSSLVLARNFGNRNGVADTLRFDDELRSKQQFLFAQVEYSLPQDWLLTGGLSLNQLNLDIYRLWDAALKNSNRLVRNFGGLAMPRLTLLKNWKDRHVAHASWSKGFSPPTIQEIRTNEGSLNREIEPEFGTNWELGYRYRSEGYRFNSSLSAFRFVLDQTIVTRTDANGVVLFRNAGNTLQQGLELQVDYQLSEKYSHAWGLKLGAAYTYHHFRFDEYRQNQNDFSGKAIPGIAPHLWVGKIDLENKAGFYFHATHTFSDAVPLNDANTTYASSFHLVQLRGGKRMQLSFGKAEAFAGVDNLLDARYSLGNDLNAFGGRFFQPAFERNFYVGLRIKTGG
jgi:iron complex outermembrane receptor protein